MATLNQKIIDLGDEPSEEYQLTPEEHSFMEDWKHREETIIKYCNFMAIMNNDNRNYAYGDGIAESITEPVNSLIQWLEEHTPPLFRWLRNAFADKHVQNLSKNINQSLSWATCLIENTDENGDPVDENDTEYAGLCESYKYKQYYNDKPVTFSVLEIYGNLYKYPDYEKPKIYSEANGYQILSREDSVEIVSQIQRTTGLYYTEVMNNIISIMQLEAKQEGVDISTDDWVNPRIMPYDIDAMTTADQKIVGVSDPRVTRSTALGILANNSFDLTISTKLKGSIANFLINIAGRVSELTVWMDHTFTLDYLDSIGLSPAKLWTSSIVTVLSGLFLLFFILRCAFDGWKYIKGEGVLWPLFVHLIITILLIGIFTVISLNPQKNWNKIKGTISNFINMGQYSLTLNNTQYADLFGDGNDPSVAYWIPYFDTWSTYNTGYGITDSVAKIDYNQNKPETDGLKDYASSRHITLWPELLADSFKYNDETKTAIRANAYRVVDHYMAPRVDATCNDSTCSLSVRENENLNNNYQIVSITNLLTIVSKIGIIFITFLIVLVKGFTIVYLWYLLYLLLFHIMMKLGTDYSEIKKSFVSILQIMLALLFIGLYAGIIIYVGGYLTGVVGIVIVIGLYIVSISMIRFWSDTFPNAYPKTLRWLSTLLSRREVIR